MRGEIRLTPDDPTTVFPDVDAIRLVRKGVSSMLHVESVRAAGNAYLVSFEGYVDRDQVQGALAGGAVWVPRDSLAIAEPGEAYVYELVGARVIDEGGRELGTVGAVLEGAAQDLLRIDPGERLLPMVPATMRGFDRTTRVLTIAPIPGLWDQ